MRFNNMRGCQTDGAVITGISRRGGKNRTSGPITAIMQFTPQIISGHEPNQINFYLFTHQIDNFNINNCKKSHQYGLNYNTLFWTFTSVASVWSTVRFSKTLESSSKTTKTQSSSEVDTSNLPSYSQVKLLLWWRQLRRAIISISFIPLMHHLLSWEWVWLWRWCNVSRYTCHKMCYSPVTTGQLITASLLMTGLGPVIDITNVTPTPTPTYQHILNKWDFSKSSWFFHVMFI